MSNSEGFSDRLKEACDENPHIPAYGQGRQTWIKERIHVSHEAVRKWFTGEARPRPAKMRELAELVGADEPWLALGIRPEVNAAETRRRERMLGGAVNVFMGLAQLAGARVAFPDDKDPRVEFVDFYVAFGGQQVPIHVSLAKETALGTYKVAVPNKAAQCVTVFAVATGRLRVDFHLMPPELVTKHRRRKGGYAEVRVSKGQTVARTGKDRWPLITDFRQFAD